MYPNGDDVFDIPTIGIDAGMTKGKMEGENENILPIDGETDDEQSDDDDMYKNPDDIIINGDSPITTSMNKSSKSTVGNDIIIQGDSPGMTPIKNGTDGSFDI